MDHKRLRLDVPHTARVTGNNLEISSNEIIGNGFCLCMTKSDVKLNLEGFRENKKCWYFVDKKPVGGNNTGQFVAWSDM